MPAQKSQLLGKPAALHVEPHPARALTGAVTARLAIVLIVAAVAGGWWVEASLAKVFPQSPCHGIVQGLRVLFQFLKRRPLAVSLCWRCCHCRLLLLPDAVAESALAQTQCEHTRDACRTLNTDSYTPQPGRMRNTYLKALCLLLVHCSSTGAPLTALDRHRTGTCAP